MKKLFILMLTAVMSAMCFTSCKETNTPAVLWNVVAQAKGEGTITIGYPTGAPGLVVTGAAQATATTTNDTTAVKGADGFFLVPNDGFDANVVLENPKQFKAADVEAAEKVVAAANGVTFEAEGEWEASVKGYLKYDRIYLVIDESWPRDTTAVAAVAADTTVVAE